MVTLALYLNYLDKQTQFTEPYNTNFKHVTTKNIETKTVSVLTMISTSTSLTLLPWGLAENSRVNRR